MMPAAGSSMPVKHENNTNHRLADVICFALLKLFANDTLRTWLAENSSISNEDNLHYYKLTIRLHRSHFTKGLSAAPSFTDVISNTLSRSTAFVFS